MWTVLFVACSTTACYPGTATLSLQQTATVEDCKAGAIEGLSVFLVQNPKLRIRGWTCRGPAAGLKGAVYE